MPKAALDTKGLSNEQILTAYRTMITARMTEDKCSIILRQSKGGTFQISGPGHEAALVAGSMVMRPGHDWSLCHYRDLTYCLGLGVTTEEIFTGFMAREGDPASNSRQMPAHFGHAEHRIISKSSCVGTQWLQAAGRAWGSKRDGTDEVTYVSGGDAGIAQGEFHEAMNWATIHKSPVLFHVEDNGYGISTPKEQERAQPIDQWVKGYNNLGIFPCNGLDLFESYQAFKKAHDWCRKGKGPAIVVSKVVRLWGHSSSDNQKLYMTDEQIAAERAKDPNKKLREWIVDNGLADDDELVALEAQVKNEIDEAADRADEKPHPDPSDATSNVFYEGENPLLDGTGEASEPSSTGDRVPMIEAINHALHEEFERDENLVCWGQDVQDGKGGVFGATKGLSTKYGVDRVFNSPLAEATIIGTSLGYSYKEGRKAVCEIQFGDYIFPAMMQVINEVATTRFRSGGNWASPMVIRVPVGGYIQGAMYHSQCIDGIFATRPGLRIAMPSNAADAKGLLKASIRGNDPVLFMECKNLYRQERCKSPEPDKDYVLPFGRGKIVREGSDVTLVTWGNTVMISQNAAQDLESKGINVEIIDLRTILPWDQQMVFDSIAKTNRCIVVHEDTITMGFGAEISARIMEEAFEQLDAPVKRVAAKDSFCPYAKPLENGVLPQKDQVIHAVEALVGW